MDFSQVNNPSKLISMGTTQELNLKTRGLPKKLNSSTFLRHFTYTLAPNNL